MAESRPAGHGPAGHGPADGPGPRAGHGHGGRAADGGHAHGAGPQTDERYLFVALAMIALFMAAEVIAGLLSGSLALLADAGHMLTDAGALAGSIWAARLAARPAGGVWTFGFKRAEIVSAAVNGVTLAAIALLIAVEAVSRLVHPPPVAGGVVLGVAIAGVAVNAVATWVIGKASRTSLNVRGAFAHILTDLYAFAGTAVAGLVILLTGWERADAVASLLVAGLMARAAWGLLRDAGRILLEAAPEQVDLAEVRTHLRQAEHVIDVHDLHAWTVTSGQPTLSAHVVLSDHCFGTGHAPEILDSLQACLGAHFGIEHATVQLEPASHAAHENEAHI